MTWPPKILKTEFIVLRSDMRRLTNNILEALCDKLKLLTRKVAELTYIHIEQAEMRARSTAAPPWPSWQVAVASLMMGAAGPTTWSQNLS